MKRLCLPLLFSISTAFSLNAQQSYNKTEPFLKANAFWALYTNNGLDFSGGNTAHVTTSMQPIVGRPEYGEGVAAVSDPHTGELLFYTNGIRIWDKNHNVMPNGDSLFGNREATTAQGACIVPVPGAARKYYIFSLGGKSTPKDFRGLYYSIVDLDLSGGNGNVEAANKNIPLDTSNLLSEGMISIAGNNCNIWLLTHGVNSQNYYAFEITASGVNHIPVVSQGLYTFPAGFGYLSVSPDRSKVAMVDLNPPFFNEAQYGIQSFSEISKFDVNTGMVSDPVSIIPKFDYSSVYPGLPDSFYICGVSSSAFSPNSDVLYLTQFDIISGGGFPKEEHVLLTQFDVSVHDSISINGSHLILDTLMTDAGADGHQAALKSYRDSIYVFYLNSDTLGRINLPNNLGPSCGFVENVFQLPVPFKIGYNATSPNEVVYPFGSSNLLYDTMVCENEAALGITLHAAHTSGSTDGFVWSDNSTGAELTVYNAGKYWVNYSYFGDNCLIDRTDTFEVSYFDFPEPQINIDVKDLGTALSYSSYQWMFNGTVINGATDSTYTVTENGDYQVIVTNAEGCVDTSAIYTVDNVSIAPYEKKFDVRVYPNPVSDKAYIQSPINVKYSLYHIDGREIVIDQNGREVLLQGVSAGVYLINVYSLQGELIYRSRISKF